MLLRTGLTFDFFDSSRSQSPPNAYLNLFLLVDLFEDEGHGIEEDDSANEGEDLDDGLEKEPDFDEVLVEGIC